MDEIIAGLGNLLLMCADKMNNDDFLELTKLVGRLILMIRRYDDDLK